MKAWICVCVFYLLLRLHQGFPCGSAGKESSCNAGDLGSIPGLGRSPEEGKGYPLQYSCLENYMDCIVHGVTKSRTWLNNFHLRKSKRYDFIVRLQMAFISPTPWSLFIFPEYSERMAWSPEPGVELYRLYSFLSCLPLKSFKCLPLYFEFLRSYIVWI